MKRPQRAVRAVVTLIGVAAACFAGCSNDRSCAIDDDCFAGEYCSGAQECVVGTRSSNTGPTDDPDSGGADVGTSADSGPGTNGATDRDACQVDLFGNTCTDDEFEENDLYTQTLPVPIPQGAWCEDQTLAASSHTFDGTLCPGDQADLFRILINNTTPNACLADSFTLRTTVELDVGCDSNDLVRIFPYLSFENPNLNSPCDQDDDLRCLVSDDQRTYTFEWLRQSEQLVDQRLIIAPREDDVQVGYTVTVEVVQ